MKTRKTLLNNARLIAALVVASVSMATAALAAEPATTAAPAARAQTMAAPLTLDPSAQVSPEDVARSAGYCQYVWQQVCNPFTGICIYQWVMVCF